MTTEGKDPAEADPPEGTAAEPATPGRFVLSGDGAGLVFGLLAAVLMLLVAFVVATSEDHPVDEEGYVSQPYINVKDYGARGDGVTDDAPAIQAAISDNVGQTTMQTLYFPAGVYLVGDRLDWRTAAGEWQPYLTLQGETEATTIIRLKDNAAGYGDVRNPKAVLYTASGLFVEEATGGGKDYEDLGEGNEAFRNFIYDLTIETGAGNRGAIGIDYLGNNISAIRNVTVRSGDGQGIAGIAMTRRWVGPALLKNVSIFGFDHGIAVGHTEYSLTFENISLQDQRLAGIVNDSNVLSIRGLTSQNSVPAVHNVEGPGLVVLVDADLRGGSSSESAIHNEAGEVYLRNVTTAGYRSAMKDGSTVVPGSSVTEYASSGAIAPGAGTLKLEIRETPEMRLEPVDAWVSVTDFGARPFTPDGEIDYGDDTAAVQRAIDSGAKTIYFPPGRYYLSDTIFVRRNVQRIEFRGSIIGISEQNHFGDGRPVIRVADGRSDVILLNQIGELDSANAPDGIGPMIKHASSRTLVIVDSAIGSFRNLRGSGPLFLENVCCGQMQFDGQEVWARQLDVETDSSPMVANNGGSLWVLGLKTERPSTIIQTRGGGGTEILGGLLYPVQQVDSDMPAFVSEDSRQSLIYAVTAFSESTNYTTQVRTTKNGSTNRLASREVIQRGLAGSIVLLLRD